MQEALGLDIGGANLKAATSDGLAARLAFPLWKQPDKLTGAIIELLLRMPQKGPVALTMTGELCDCFPDKSSGVRHILAAAKDALRDRPIFIWRNDGKWAGLQHALEDPLPVAAANWLASATYAGRYLPHGPGWFFDLGSSTLDMIPLLDGKPVPKGKTDLQRLKSGELAYLGASRTPITSIVQSLTVDKESVSVATEYFATLDDAMLMLELTTEDEHDRNTADGRPRTKMQAQQRLARMVCADVQELGISYIQSLARQIMDAWRKKLQAHLRQALDRVLPGVETQGTGFIMAGSGEGFLAEELAPMIGMSKEATPIISMTGRVGPDLSTVLPAYALAILLAERQAR